MAGARTATGLLPVVSLPFTHQAWILRAVVSLPASDPQRKRVRGDGVSPDAVRGKRKDATIGPSRRERSRRLGLDLIRRIVIEGHHRRGGAIAAWLYALQRSAAGGADELTHW
jgi:hypothetical protein